MHGLGAGTGRCPPPYPEPESLLYAPAPWSARQTFNDAAAAYNDAMGLFPTQLVAKGFGLGRAGLL